METKDKTPTQKGLVLYTDGGWRGCGGWGVHGYTYDLVDLPAKLTKKINAPTTEGYLDESQVLKRNALPVKVTGYVDGWGSILGKSTNNVAELKAAIEGFKLAEYYDVSKVSVLSDSEYFLKGLSEWSTGWVKNGWVRRDGTEVPNKEYWQTLLENAKGLKDKGVEIKLSWVKGHSDNLGNDLADRNATRGVILAQKDLDLQNTYHSDVKKYWDNSIEYNRLLAHPNWYFSVNVMAENVSKDGRHVYYLGQHDGANEMLGKRVSTHAFSVLYLEKPEPVLEKIREYQQLIQKSDYSDLVVGYLNTILSSSVYTELSEHGCTYVTKAEQYDDLYTTEEKQLTWQARPPKLAMRAITSLNFVESLLEEYLAGNSETLEKTDVTSYFYDLEETKKGQIAKLKKAIATSAKVVDVLVKYNTTGVVKEAPVSLTFGLDIPSRNAVAALADPKVKIIVLTYRESDLGFRYCTVIESGKDVGIFNSVHANLKVVSES